MTYEYVALAALKPQPSQSSYLLSTIRSTVAVKPEPMRMRVVCAGITSISTIILELDTSRTFCMIMQDASGDAQCILFSVHRTVL